MLTMPLRPNIWLADEPTFGGYCSVHGEYTTRYCEHCLDDEMDRYYQEELEDAKTK